LEAAVTGTTRSSEGLDARRRRLLFRSWHRGTREMDLIMGRFADAAIGTLSETELDELERLSDASEPDLYAWITGERPVPPEHDTPLFHRLRQFARTPK
jgi:antitoxin CptB